MIHVTYQNSQFKPQIEYIFDLFFAIYGIDYRITDYSSLSTLRSNFTSIVISYGKQKPKSIFKHHIHIYESGLFGEKYLKPESLPKIPLGRFGNLPVIYCGYGNLDGFVCKSKNLIETNIDIIASSFFMLSRYEEVVLDKKDKFDRFPVIESLAYKEGFLNRPIVNEYIELLWSWIDNFNLGLKRKKMWEGKDFVVCLTHDVDAIKKYRIYPPLRTIGSLAIKYGDFKKALGESIGYIKAKLGKDPYDSFTYIMHLEAKYGFRSSFYFMSGGDTNHDRNYSIKNPYVNSLIKSLQEKDFEIGLHSSFNSYNDFQMVYEEKGELEKIIGNAILGVRQHYLRWKTPNTWRILEKAGLKYDTTLCFAEHEGFRCGICFPYKPFDIIENRVLNIWELPLTVMDGSLFNYQNLNPEEGFQRIKILIDTVKKYNGVFVLLWHNSSFDRIMLRGWDQVYEKTLEYIGKQNVLNDTVREIISWWEKNISENNN